jgi:hypothetical protein
MDAERPDGWTSSKVLHKSQTLRGTQKNFNDNGEQNPEITVHISRAIIPLGNFIYHRKNCITQMESWKLMRDLDVVLMFLWATSLAI